MLTLAPLDAAPGVRHGFFTRRDGVSEGIYASRNCGFGSGDSAEHVRANRDRCLEELGGGAGRLVTVYQVHSAEAVTVERPWAAEDAPRADALATDRRGLALGILTADCAPVLLADAEAGVIGAAHAGWKGALGGVAEAAIVAMEELGARRERIGAAIGPTIGAESYEVGEDFRERFLADDPASGAFFRRPDGAARPFFDLSGYVAGRLAAAGVGRVAAHDGDTCADEARFFSYRRACHRGEPDYGRLLSAIALETGG
ncbi:MAG: peptidoglycan editing factor PgeF [Azospirillaceae bacterium]